jgi:hypothetical protein
MGRSVNISTEIPPPLSMVNRLRIPKARQKELTEMFERAVERLKGDEEAGNLLQRIDNSSAWPETTSVEDGKKRKIATAAR